MKPGRVPKNNVHKLRTAGANQPQFVAPECPGHLSGEARAEWSRIVPMLERYKLVTDIDTAALALYCQSYGRWQQAENKLNKLRDAGLDALIIESPNGYQIRNPWFDIANRCMEDCYKYLQQFGLSPAARTRVEPGKPIQGNLFPDEPGQEYFT